MVRGALGGAEGGRKGERGEITEREREGGWEREGERKSVVSLC